MIQYSILIVIKHIESLLLCRREYVFEFLETQAVITIGIHIRKLLAKHAGPT